MIIMKISHRNQIPDIFRSLPTIPDLSTSRLEMLVSMVGGGLSVYPKGININAYFSKKKYICCWEPLNKPINK